MILVSELYEVCSDVFDSTETQFHSSLNLHGKHEPIKIRHKQKIKACYLISKLYEIVPAKHKAAWREDILAHLDIQWSYYEKKYCNAHTQTPQPLMTSSNFVVSGRYSDTLYKRAVSTTLNNTAYGKRPVTQPSSLAVHRRTIFRIA